MTLTIVEQRGGRLPGRLRCVCGLKDLAIWSAEHGTARCDCGRWWTLDEPYSGPGVYGLADPRFGHLDEVKPRHKGEDHAL